MYKRQAADSVVGDMLTEDVVPAPVGPYGESKIAAENYILGRLKAEDGRLKEFGYRIRSSARYCEARPMKSNSRHATVAFVRNGKALFRVKPGNLPSLNIDNSRFPGARKANY